MATEIERKFLLSSDDWRSHVSDSLPITQGYLAPDPECTIRVRISGDRSWLTIKGKTKGLVRPEFEYEIPFADGNQLITLCHKKIEKVRHLVTSGMHTWEIDEFQGANQGLIVAEIELGSVDESFNKPDWIGEEVSDDPRFFNVNLLDNPYLKW